MAARGGLTAWHVCRERGQGARKPCRRVSLPWHAAGDWPSRGALFGVTKLSVLSLHAERPSRSRSRLAALVDVLCTRSFVGNTPTAPALCALNQPLRPCKARRRAGEPQSPRESPSFSSPPLNSGHACADSGRRVQYGTCRKRGRRTPGIDATVRQGAAKEKMETRQIRRLQRDIRLLLCPDRVAPSSGGAHGKSRER